MVTCNIKIKIDNNSLDVLLDVLRISSPLFSMRVIRELFKKSFLIQYLKFKNLILGT